MLSRTGRRRFETDSSVLSADPRLAAVIRAADRRDDRRGRRLLSRVG